MGRIMIVGIQEIWRCIEISKSDADAYVDLRQSNRWFLENCCDMAWATEVQGFSSVFCKISAYDHCNRHLEIGPLTVSQSVVERVEGDGWLLVNEFGLQASWEAPLNGDHCPKKWEWTNQKLLVRKNLAYNFLAPTYDSMRFEQVEDCDLEYKWDRLLLIDPAGTEIDLGND